MTRHRFLLPGSAAVLVLGLLAAYLYAHLERRTETLDHGPSPEARADDYLAAERFLRQQELVVERRQDLRLPESQPARGHTLLLLADRSEMTPAQAERLLAWAARGGHLIFVAEQLWNEEQGRSGDLLLDRLGLQQVESHATRPSPSSGTALPDLTRLYLAKERAPAYFDFDTRFHLYDPSGQAHAWANSAAATHLLQRRHGQGLVTVLTDAWLWNNAHIAEYDHAWLLWYLVQDSTVTLLGQIAPPSLPVLLASRFPAALTALALLLALSLWHATRRRGPLLDTPAPERRQLLEHLRASTDFLLRHAGQSHLLDTLQRDIDQRAGGHHPGFEQLSAAERTDVLTRLSGLPAGLVEAAMRPARPGQRLGGVAFTRQVAHLQTLRNAL